MQWVPDVVVSRLDAQVKLLRDSGYPAFRKDVLGLLVLYCAPRSSQGVTQMTEAYLLKTPPSLRGRRDCRSLMLTLPSPISIRIDVLVEAATTFGFPIYRQDLVGALIVERAPEDALAMGRLFKRYRRAKAKDAGVKGVPLQRLLSTTRPRQGPRPRGA